MVYKLFHNNHFQSYAGNFLISTNMNKESLFNEAVIYVCVHDISGAMGIIVNRTMNQSKYTEIISQSEVIMMTTNEVVIESPVVHLGGPVETEKSLILHSNDYNQNETIYTPDGLAVTTNHDALRDVLQGNGPKDCVFAMGYAAWYPGQLEAEILSNHWLLTESNKDIIFNAPNEDKWNLALAHAGISYSNYLSIIHNYGHA